MDRLLNAMTVASLLLIGLVLISVRRQHIRVEYSVSWLVAGLALLVLSRWRDLGERIAASEGVPGLAITLLTVSGVVFVAVLFVFSLRISELKDSGITLAQRVAILEFRLESLSKQTAPDKTQPRADAAAAPSRQAFPVADGTVRSSADAPQMDR